MTTTVVTAADDGAANFPFSGLWESEGFGYSLSGVDSSALLETIGSATVLSVNGAAIGCLGVVTGFGYGGTDGLTSPVVIVALQGTLPQGFFDNIHVTPASGGTGTKILSSGASSLVVLNPSTPVGLTGVTVWAWPVTTATDYFASGVNSTVVFNFLANDITPVTATPASSTEVDIAFTDTVGTAAGYDVWRDGVYLQSGPSSPIVDSTCVPSTTYAYQVFGVTVGGDYLYDSIVVSATTPAGDILAPDLSGMTQADAETAITDLGLTVGTIDFVVDVLVPAGEVQSQSPGPGIPMNAGDPLSFTLSSGGTFTTYPLSVDDEAVYGGVFGGKLNLVEFTYMPGRTPFEAGATNLIINRYKQEPDDSRQRGVDFTQFVTTGEVLQTVSLVGISAQGVLQEDTSPLVTPLAVTNIIIDPVTQLKFAYTVSGGQNGVEYTVKFASTTQLQSQSLEEIFSINVLIEDQFP